MATSSRLLADDTCKETVKIWNENGEDVVKKFKCKLPFDWHFRYCHIVGDHNNLRHLLSSIENAWAIDWLRFQVIDFILSIS